MYNENRVGIASSNKLYTFKKNNLNKTRKSTQRMRCVTTSLALHDVQRVCTDDHGSVWKTGQKAFLDVRVFNPLAGRCTGAQTFQKRIRDQRKREEKIRECRAENVSANVYVSSLQKNKKGLFNG